MSGTGTKPIRQNKLILVICLFTLLLLGFTKIQYAEIVKTSTSSLPEFFAIGEQEHINGNFEEARSWYQMFFKDLPESNLAPEACLRSILISFVLLTDYLTKENIEIQKANKYYDEAAKLYYLLKEEMETEGDYHLKQANEQYNKREKESKVLLTDYLVFKEQYLKSHQAYVWLIPYLPKTTEEISEYGSEKVKLMTNYNNNIGKVCEVSVKGSKNKGKFAPLEFTYTIGAILFDCESTHSKGKKELEEILDLTKNDPSDRVRTKVKETLEREPLYKLHKEMFEKKI